MRINPIKIVKLLFFTYIVILLSLMVLTLNTQDFQTPEMILGIDIDKVVHFILFLPFPFLMWYSFKKRFEANVKIFLLVIVPLSGIILAVSLECIQSLNPQRDFDLYDIAANLISVIFASLILISGHFINVWFRKLQ